ncbi:condensation domain-containing protein [Nocardia terpenica]|uniref:Condensation domain-containing protein n=1 Tax=Nocardia terpenica TaxID=455432 RepID=A0A6G9Z2Z8_9NOCA|nr:condensation domain-containing protein [Nocardia terpenica]QIS19852.1 hypothetical protein F6W96_17705 [Nocardia terpenica]
MEMTHLSEWLPKPGELLEFVPVARAVAAVAPTSVATVPASFIQEFHIRYWHGRRLASAPEELADNVRNELSMCFSMAVPLDRVALRQAYTEYLRRHDSLRCWFDIAESPETPLVGHVLDPEAVELATVSLGSFDSSEELRDRLGVRFQTPDPTGWPAFTLGAIDHGMDGFTVYVSFDHAFTDGTSLVASIFEVHQLYTAFAADREPELPPVTGYAEYARQERDTVAAHPPELEQLARILADNVDNIRPTPWELGLAPGEFGDSTGTRYDLLTGDEVNAFTEACAANGGSFASGLYAAIALTELELAGRTRYLGLNVVGTRLDPRFQFTQGWFINLVPVAFEVGEAARFTELVGRARGALGDIKPLSGIPLLAALRRATELTGGREFPQVRDWPWVSYMDMRPISGAMLEQSLPGLNGIRGLSSSSRIGQPSPLWFNREHDRVHVAVMFPDTAVAHASVDEYLDRLRTVCRSIATAGEYGTVPVGSEAT